MKEEIKKIERKLSEIWRRERKNVSGFDRLSLAYAIFTAVDENGEMVFHDLCKFFVDSKNGRDGKEDFTRFINCNIDFTDVYKNYTDDSYNINVKAEEVADEYFNEQAHRLASYIVRIEPIPVTN